MFYKELYISINHVDHILYLDVIFLILISFYKICPSNIFYKEMIIKFLSIFKKSMENFWNNWKEVSVRSKGMWRTLQGIFKLFKLG